MNTSLPHDIDWISSTSMTRSHYNHMALHYNSSIYRDHMQHRLWPHAWAGGACWYPCSNMGWRSMLIPLCRYLLILQTLSEALIPSSLHGLPDRLAAATPIPGHHYCSSVTVLSVICSPSLRTSWTAYFKLLLIFRLLWALLKFKVSQYLHNLPLP